MPAHPVSCRRLTVRDYGAEYSGYSFEMPTTKARNEVDFGTRM
jgi:hypothetical protein